ncbi:serine hydrolase [Nonomuraea sp. SMC257]|uniref:Serine hydrolase n=1 Tax=Nonomuraea montanisoli TaxID=2741721 RepID=A0A7Y6IBF4_9ACTN|nr:serine hydrolase [Nonomuraea montanisoli]NUW35152.1 serine hydrolase [Nonomuraea montanisoli]
MIVGRAVRRAALVTVLVAPAAASPPVLTSAALVTSPVPAVVALRGRESLLPGPSASSVIESIEFAPRKVADRETPAALKRKTAKAAPVPTKTLTKELGRYLAGRPGPVTAMVRDLTDGRLYRYHRDERLITASSAKVQILMALLLRTPWRELPQGVRRDADLMIRYSDNHAADRLWTRIGGPDGFTRAGRRFGLRNTSGVPGKCVDLYCWGITPTSAEDQVRLMRALVSDRSPLPGKDRDQVLRLMGRVIPGQDWGISAAACGRDRVALKNGWLKRVSTKRWAVVTVGLLRGRGKGAAGHDYAVAVLSEGAAEVGNGIATVEGVAKRAMKAFRACRRS